MKAGQPFNPYGIFRNVLVPFAILRIPKLSYAAKILYGALNAHCGRDGRVYPSQATLAHEIGCTDVYVRKLLTELEDKELIQIVNPTGKARLAHLHNQYVFLWHESLEQSTSSVPDRNNCCSPGSAGCCGPPNTSVLKLKSSSPAGRATRQATLLPVEENTLPTLAETSARFQKTFCRLWEKKYGHPYPFNGKKDGANIKTLHSRLKGDRATFKTAVERYLAEEGDFFRGHPVGKLLSELPRFLVAGEEEEGGGGGEESLTREDLIRLGRITFTNDVPPGYFGDFGSASPVGDVGGGR